VQPFKVQCVRHAVTFKSVQCQPGLTYFLIPERQSARMSEIKNVGQTWMVKCNQLTPLPFKGLNRRQLHDIHTGIKSRWRRNQCHFRNAE